jgi:predicted PurR-regulated permease PerM
MLLIGRHFYQGFGLLITYAAVSLIRQILEPRVVSGALGVHPMLTLFCMYGGYRLFGILGMMLAPAAVIFLSGLVQGDQSSSRSGP